MHSQGEKWPTWWQPWLVNSQALQLQCAHHPLETQPTSPAPPHPFPPFLLLGMSYLHSVQYDITKSGQ